MIQLAILAAIGIAVLVLITAIIGHAAKKTDGLQGPHYVRAEAVFSPAERSFYGVLVQAVAARCVILGKIRLADIIKPEPGLSPSQRTSALNRVSSKHVDFVLCDPASLTILGVIELDDKSHLAERRKQRDAFVDAALRDAGIPILHVTAQRAYSTSDVRAQIQGLLT